MSPFKARLGAFTILEMMVALAVIGISVTAVLTILSAGRRLGETDLELMSAVRYCDDYFGRLWLAEKPEELLFSEEERRVLSGARDFPVFMPPAQTNMMPGVTVILSRRVRRFSPLLADIGAEVLVKIGGRERRFWMETTLSGAFLDKLTLHGENP